MRRLAALTVATIVVLGAASAHAAPQGCVVSNPPNLTFPNPCSAAQGTDWIYLAGGDWEIKIEYADGSVKRLSSAAGDPDSGTLAKGGLPTAKAITPGSFVVMGDPSPLAADGVDPAPVPRPVYSVEDNRVAVSADGTPIVYRLLIPEAVDASRPAPAAIGGHGWAGNRYTEPSWDYATRMLLNAGYVVLLFDSRGFGQSGGTVQFNHVDFEGRDVKALVDVLAADPRVVKERPGDPRVGLYGGSYGGGVQYVAAAADDRIDAITPLSSWNDIVGALRPQGQLRAGFMTMLAAVGLVYATASGLDPQSPAGPQTGTLDPMLARFIAEAATGDVSPEAEAYMRDRGPANLLQRVRVPTLIGAGQQDMLFQPSQALANYRGLSAHLTGDHLRLLWFCGGHGTCKPSYFEELMQRDRVPREIVRWFERWVRGDEGITFPGRFSYMTQDGGWHDSPRLEPTPERSSTTVSTAQSIMVANGEPTAGGGSDPLVYLPVGNLGVPIGGTPLGQPQRVGVTTAKYPLPDVLGTILGSPRVKLTTLAGSAGAEPIALYFRLVDRRTGEVVANQETLRTFPGDLTRRTVSFELEPLAWRGSPEQDLALEITSHSANFEPSMAVGAVQIERVEVVLPLTG